MNQGITNDQPDSELNFRNFKRGGLLLEVVVGWYVSGFKHMEDQEWTNISVNSMREVQLTSVWKKQAWRAETNIKITCKSDIIIN